MISVLHEQGGTAFVVMNVTRLDAAVAYDVKEQIGKLIADGNRRLVLDFGEVDFLDSSGLGALVGCRKLLGATGKIEIARPSEKVQKVLKLTRMYQVFTVTDTMPMAS